MLFVRVYFILDALNCYGLFGDKLVSLLSRDELLERLVETWIF